MSKPLSAAASRLQIERYQSSPHNRHPGGASPIKVLKWRRWRRRSNLRSRQEIRYWNLERGVKV